MAAATGGIRTHAPPCTALALVLGGAAAAVRRGDATRVPLTRLDAALLAVLAVEGAVSRRRLLQMLWPDAEPESARNALRQRLFRLRRAVGADLVIGTEQIALAGGVTNDLHEAGALLSGADYADRPEFDAWLDAQRASLARRRRETDLERIAACEREGRCAEGIDLAELLIHRDPLDEPALRALMRLCYLGGRGGVPALRRCRAARRRSAVA